eukprot:3349223-Amphidinium_carterae.1
MARRWSCGHPCHRQLLRMRKHPLTFARVLAIVDVRRRAAAKGEVGMWIYRGFQYLDRHTKGITSHCNAIVWYLIIDLHAAQKCQAVSFHSLEDVSAPLPVVAQRLYNDQVCPDAFAQMIQEQWKHRCISAPQHWAQQHQYCHVTRSNTQGVMNLLRVNAVGKAGVRHEWCPEWSRSSSQEQPHIMS